MFKKVTLAFLLSASTALAQSDPFSAMPASAFQDSIGICTHLGYDAAHGWGANAYGDFTGKVIPALQYLGAGKLKKLRDSMAYSYYFDKFQQINQQFGITFTLYAGTGPSVDLASGLSWAKANQAVVTAVEGTNEPDNWPPLFDGMKGPAATVAEQKTISSDMSATNTLVYGPSIGNPANLAALGNLSDSAQFTNAHAYPSGGRQPGAWLGDWLQKSSAATPGKPVVITEGGFSTATQSSDGASVPQDVAAKQILNMLFDAYFDYTVMETDLYELLDEYPDPGGADREKHFGLFNYDGSPKPSATALRNLLAIIDDKHGSQAGRLAFTTQGLNGKAVLMVKADGSFLIGVWSEPQIWNDSTHSESTAPVQQVTVVFGERATTATVYDPLVGTDPISTAQNVNQVTVEVRDHPIIIQLNGPAGLTTAGLTIPTPTIGEPDNTTPIPPPVNKWDALAQQGAAAAAQGETFMAPDGDTIFIPPGGTIANAVLTEAEPALNTAGGIHDQSGMHATASPPVSPSPPATSGNSPSMPLANTAKSAPPMTAGAAKPVARGAAFAPQSPATVAPNSGPLMPRPAAPAPLTAGPGHVPMVITETGYTTDPRVPNGVSPAAQAVLTTNALLDAAKAGTLRTYLYELMDQSPDAGNTNQEMHFGLFNADNAPKPVATAIHNLTSFLSDQGAAFTPGSLNYAVSGMPSTGRSLLMQKSNGAYNIALWNDAQFNGKAAQVSAPTSDVTLNLGSTFTKVTTFDPISGATKTLNNVSQINVLLSTNPIIVEASGGSGVGAGTAAIKTSDFTGGIGVNTHMSYGNTGYSNAGNVISNLNYLGINAVRDGPAWAGSQYAALAKAGMKMDIVTNGPSTVGPIASFAQQYPGAISTIEGANEVNNWPVSYGGQGGEAGAANMQSAVYQTVRSNPALNGVPVVDYTGGATAGQNPAGKADLINIHPYALDGGQMARYIPESLQWQYHNTTPWTEIPQ